MTARDKIADLLVKGITGESVYNNELRVRDLPADFSIVEVNENDDMNEHWSQSNGITVTVMYKGQLFKSTQICGSYGGDKWTTWEEAMLKITSRYVYVGATY